MNQTKPVSVRMDEELLAKIDEISKRHTYWNRSQVICNLLEAVVTKFDAGAIYNMLRHYYYRRNKVIAKFEVTDELEPYNSK